MKRKIDIFIVVVLSLILSCVSVYAGLVESDDGVHEVQVVAPDSLTLIAGKGYTAKDLGISVTYRGREWGFDQIDEDEGCRAEIEFPNDDDSIVAMGIFWKHGDTDDDYHTRYLITKKAGKTKINVGLKYLGKVDEHNYRDMFYLGKTVDVTVKYDTKLSMDAYIKKIKRGVFYLDVTNYSNKDIVFYSSGAKSIDRDYTSFDCKLKLSKGSSVKIKPGQDKIIKYKVVKGKVWQNPYDEIVYLTCKFNGKKYKLKITDAGWYYKKGSKWI